MKAISKGQIVITILFAVLSVLLFISSGTIMVDAEAKESIVSQVETELALLEEETRKLELVSAELEEQRTVLLEQVNNLTEEINILREDRDTSAIEIAIENPKYAYLTFDDGPSDNTVKILDFLLVNNIRATFFVLERPGREDVYRRIVDEGHTIAVHSSTHDYASIYQTVDTFLADIENLSNVIYQATGVIPDVLRFPGGSNNLVSRRYGGNDIMDRIIPAMEAAGYIYFDWNVDSQDASKAVQDKDVIVNAVINQSRNLTQPVILMHDAAAKTTTVDALPEIVAGLKELGFSFERLTSDTPVVQF
ncbi:MAG: hypothetical protein ATN36_08890 [Epulopiscium sp. Nele67-Bin005]|nr:MAG: hypothetical protein ATN36_08890 [Epulopiscium sp. Nele67-Bin005]